MFICQLWLVEHWLFSLGLLSQNIVSKKLWLEGDSVNLSIIEVVARDKILIQMTLGMVVEFCTCTSTTEKLPAQFEGCGLIFRGI